MDTGQQIMIVLWKWENLGGGVNAKLFREKKYEKHLNDITLGRGHYYEEYAVEPSALCPAPCFVQTSIYKDDTNTENLLFALLTKYVSPKNEVLLFLHRAHSYSDNDVKAILSKFGKNKIKCFLFADGRDYLYYDTQKSGLLDDDGNFFIQRDEDTDEYIETFDEELMVVKQPYFDRVWSHYREEFQKKVFELKEEIFNCWFNLLLPDEPDQIAKNKLTDQLNEDSNRVLMFRINSFLGHYKINASKNENYGPTEQYNIKKELKRIEQLERLEGKSYLFDDAIANLKIEKKRGRPLVIETYSEITALMEQILFTPKFPVTKSTLRELADKLNLLVQVTPGELSN